ncbi:non-ribosomal peptide synthetase [Geminicoccus roseus]|uniref:non-ribosomal peptide synthetase n=1 Tax=Geminicoccus roseus TaxID=404900 RepID=UPI000426D58F|nr:non-ribosomal peptide synthetase [Geminicoccus roseus]
MSVADLVRDLERRGVHLAVDGDALTMRAPKGVLADRDRDALRARKHEILAWLKGDDAEAEPGAPFPLTDIQQAYLVGRAAEMELGRVGCHAYREFEAPSYDLERLEDAWNRLVRRHPMLRAVVRGDLQQVLPEVPPYRIATLDLRGDPDAEARLAALRAERSHHVFDPAAWPLFDIRATLLDDRVRLHVGLDLLVADAVSMVQLFREWGLLCRDPGAVLPAPSASFAQHCRALARSTPSAAEAYWNARLTDLPGGPDLPRQPLAAPPRFTRHSHRLAAPAWSGLKEAARARGLTPSALLATAYADILAAWSRTPRFLVVLTTFAAPPAMAGVVGDFTSTILLESDATPATFAGRATALQKRLAQDLDHAGMSGVRVMRELRRHRPDVLPATAVFTSTLGHDVLAGEPPLAWLGRTVHAITQTPQVAIDHHVLEEQGDLVASWDVVEDLFPPGVVDLMFAAYRRLLDSLASGDGWSGAVGASVDLPPRPAPQVAFTPEPLFAGLLRQAEQMPDRPALIDASGQTSFAELVRLSALAAGRLLALGAGPEKVVAVDLPKSRQQALAALAVLRAGAAYLPLDPALPPARRAELIADTSAIVPDWPALLDGQGEPAALPAVDPASLAYVIFTSGSTGKPKGVMVEHGAALNTVLDLNRRWRVGPADRVLGLSALNFDLSVYDLFGVPAAGGALVLPGEEQRRDPAAWAELVRRHRVTIWNTVPALAAMLAEHGLDPDHPLRLFLLSGDWIPLELVPKLRALAPDAELVSLGGATEAAIWSIFHPIGAPDPAWASVPYGQPLSNQTMHVVDAHGRPCPDWVVGEIEIGGIGLARGYWGDPARSEERFRTDPLTGERRYRTGDLGRFRPNNLIEFLGREDFQVKVGGHRIELGEIEAHLVQHPAVRQAVAAALPVPGQPRQKTLHAFVVAAEEPGGQDKAIQVLERPGRRRLDSQERLPLGQRSAASDFARRRSVRDFAETAVARTAFDEMLGRLAGEEGGLVRHRYPSAGSLYAVQAHLLVRPGRVEGVEGGVYYHDPVEHALVRLGSHLPPVAVAHPPTAKAVEQAAFVLLLVADLAVLRPTYGGAARDFCLLEAGYQGQLLMTDLDETALGLLPVGGLEVDGFRDALALTDDHALVHALAGGVPGAAARPESLAQRLHRHLAERLPDYMVPRRITLVERLPLTANGKVDRQALQPPAEQAPSGSAAETAAIRTLVAEILGTEAVGDHANLFDLGATSLHLVRLQRRLAEQHGERAPAVVDLFRLPTVADIARHLAEAPASTAADSGTARAQRRLEARRQLADRRQR